MDGLGDRVSLGDKGEEVFNVNDERFFQAFGYILMTLTQNCCFCSVAKSCPTLCDPMKCGMPGLPVLHHLLNSCPLSW